MKKTNDVDKNERETKTSELIALQKPKFFMEIVVDSQEQKGDISSCATLLEFVPNDHNNSLQLPSSCRVAKTQHLVHQTYYILQFEWI